jgi:hypothetical protein
LHGHNLNPVDSRFALEAIADRAADIVLSTP